MDILIPASVTDVINDKNKNDVKAKIIVEGANIPMSEDIERELSDRGISLFRTLWQIPAGSFLHMPNIAVTIIKMFELVEKKIKNATRIVLKKKVCAKKKTCAKSPWKLPNQELSRQ